MVGKRSRQPGAFSLGFGGQSHLRPASLKSGRLFLFQELNRPPFSSQCLLELQRARQVFGS